MSDQQKLFDDDPAPWDMDDAAVRLVASVVFIDGPDQEFSYLVPTRMAGQVEPGQRVRAPLGRGNRTCLGYCVKVETRDVGPRRLKELLAVVDGERLISAPLMRLAEWIKEYYIAPWAVVLETIVPAGVRDRAGTRMMALVRMSAAAPAILADMKLTPKQSAVIDWLAGQTAAVPLPHVAAAANCGTSVVQSLRKKGLVVVEQHRLSTWDAAEAPFPPTEEHLVLNDDQRQALDAVLAALNSGQHKTLLLHGITGSGKTEVYIQAIQEVIGFGRQAIVLVPEISLTPQTKSRFRARFGQVAVLHSHMSPVERNQQWQRIASGEANVVVGARSAIFAPTPHLGLIVLDEEHESSFKQGETPRYHARDVALFRAQAERVPLVLGSATPSLESFRRAQEGQYQLLRLPKRVEDRPLPDVATIDMRTEAKRGAAGGSLSRPLMSAMQATLAESGQVILLLNRRGYSTHIQCPGCGKVVRCPHCDIALTHHRTQEIVLCHYCDYQQPTPHQCPECGFAGIRYSGLGTQRLEAEVQARFREYRCLRMDTDTMQKPGSHEQALEAFRSGDVRILLGTQMIAKGLDFPNVTLVGVINADMALHLPDFRASERSFQLLVQVAGRTGRGHRGGRVLVQTFSPDHPAVQSAVRHDYMGFAKHELPMRQALQYPPYGSMVRLVIRGPLLATTSEFAKQIGQRVQAELTPLSPGSRLLGPAPCPLARLRGNYRFQIQLQGPDGAHLRSAVRAGTAGLKPPDDVMWIADVDPLEML
ncbi:MAG: primosomal protein N' [Pirellulales bacterium]